MSVDPKRWRDGEGDEDLRELWQRAAPHEAWRVRRGAAALPSSLSLSPPRSLRTWLFGGSATLIAAGALAIGYWPRPPAPIPVQANEAPVPAPILAPPPVVQAPPPQPASVLARPPEYSKLGSKRPPPVSSAPAAPPAPAPVAAPSSAPASGDLAVETRAIAEITRLLNHDRNAVAALDALVTYRRAFPEGKLRAEADMAEIKADLALDRRDDALSLLDRLQGEQFRDVPRAFELRLLRGELMAESGDCAGALPAFASALAGRPTMELEERALFDRADCRRSLGDLTGARDDFRRYLERFPHGRFAPQAQEGLGEGE